MPSSYNPPASGGASWVRKTANFTAVSGGMYLMDTSGGSFTVTAPSSPVDGDYFFLANAAGYWKINPPSIDTGGGPVQFNYPSVCVVSYDGAVWVNPSLVVPDGSYVVGGGGSTSGIITIDGGNTVGIQEWA